jgi:hypothetical protein
MRLAGVQKQPRNTHKHDRLTPVSTPESLIQGPSSIKDSSIVSTDATQLTVANAHTTFPGPMADSHFLIMSDMTACSALAVIAQRLQLHCQPQPGFNIQALTDDLPSAIAPTTLQKSVPHLSYLDMLPWATIRDNILKSITTINQGEFMSDMRIGSLRVWGTVPWDPIGWEVGEDFAKKWWFLLDEGIIQTTNFWRSQRGETPLSLAKLHA